MLELLSTILNAALVVLRVVVVVVGLKCEPEVPNLPVPLLEVTGILVNEPKVLVQSLSFVPSLTRRFICRWHKLFSHHVGQRESTCVNWWLKRFDVSPVGKKEHFSSEYPS